MAYFARKPAKQTTHVVETEKDTPPVAVEETKPTEAFNGTAQEVGGMEGESRTSTGDPVTRKCMEAMRKMKLVLKQRGTHGIISLGRKFKSMDDNGSGSLDYGEFKKALSEMGFDEGEYQALFRFFDRDCSGTISYDEFITGLRGELNDRRKELVFMAYKVLDKNGDGTVDMQDMISRYDASNHPDVLSGRKKKYDVVREFLDVFDGGEKDGIITPTEFAQYYMSISANIDLDDYFELMIRNAWHISGGEGWCENTTNKRVLVTHPDGSQTVEEIKNDFDIDKEDTAAMKQNLAEQGIEASSIETKGKVDGESSESSAKKVHRTDLQDNRAKMTQSSITF